MVKQIKREAKKFMSCNVREIQTGTKLSEIQYYTVVRKEFGSVIVKNERGQQIHIAKDIVEDGCSSASQVDEVRKVTKTEIAEIFKKSSRIVVTVCYNKQVKVADLLKKDVIESFYPETRNGETKAQFTKRVKGILKEKSTGEERIMVGRHYGNTDINGRVSMLDMEQPIVKSVAKDGKEYDKRSRLVDTRTIKWLIADGVRYEIK